MFEIRQIKEGSVWERFVLTQPHTLFVQSSHYGAFYRALGEEAWILGVFNGEELVGGSLVVSIHAKRGKFLYVPYGPILPKVDKVEALGVWAKAMFNLGKEKGCNFLRVSPYLEDGEASRAMFRQEKFRLAPMHILAETTWLLNIEKSEDNLLAGMNKNHRNLIRRCLGGGVRIEKTASPDALKSFNDLLDNTAKRHKFHRFSGDYIRHEFAVFAAHQEALIFNAYLPDGSLDASAIIIYYGNMACYRHSASRGLEKRLPTSYLLQWEAIQEAKRRGMKWYNFWGIAPDGVKGGHPFSGITHFKKGFGGQAMNLVPCQDLPLSPAYWFNWVLESFRRVKRGF